MNTNQWIRTASDRLRQANIECGDFTDHANRIFQSALGLSSADVALRWTDEIKEAEREKLEIFLQRRVGREPLQYISGVEWFWKSSFQVGPGVLIPRPETEHLISLCLEKFPSETNISVAELGAGSGNIGISLLLERPNWRYFAFEKNPESVKFAAVNAKNLLCNGEKYQLVEGDFFDGASGFAPFDLIVANPPYVGSGESVSAEVQREPSVAVFSGETGFEVSSVLIRRAAQLLKDRGMLIIEIGCTQKEEIERLFSESGFMEIETKSDYCGHPRIVKGVKNGRIAH